MSLLGKVVVVTGGSKGIGRAISERLARDGASVVTNFSQDATAAEETIKNIGADKAYAVQADVGSIVGVEKLVKATVEKFGRIDVIVPNAGIMPMKTVESTSEADFDQIFALNVKGPFFLAQVCFLASALVSKKRVTDTVHRKPSHTWPQEDASFSSALASTVQQACHLHIHCTRQPRARSTRWSVPWPRIWAPRASTSTQ